MATAIARELPSWSGSQTLGNRPLLMRCIKLGGLRQQVMCAGHLLLLCYLCLRLFWLASYIFSNRNGRCLSREGEAQACDCEQPSWRNQGHTWIQGKLVCSGTHDTKCCFSRSPCNSSAITGRYICCSAVCINQKFNLSCKGQQN